MGNQKKFERHEIKYLITNEQKEIIKNAVSEYMREDEHGHSEICNIYFDTPDMLLIRRSIEKPSYKEKLRIRSYGTATDNSNVFVELKKKYKDVVYKRRVDMPYDEAINYLLYNEEPEARCQITDEIDYFLSLYKNIQPAMYIAYERDAFYDKKDDSFRVTFDENILWRTSDLSLCSEMYGTPLLEENQVLMEVKAGLAMPLWFTKILTDNKIYKASFTKYGNAYKDLMTKGEYQYVR